MNNVLFAGLLGRKGKIERSELIPVKVQAHSFQLTPYAKL